MAAFADSSDKFLTRITNEFAAVVVSEHRTAVGTRLAIHSERDGRTVYLDAVCLEALCWLTPAAVSRFVALVQEDSRPITADET